MTKYKDILQFLIISFIALYMIKYMYIYIAKQKYPTGNIDFCGVYYDNIVNYENKKVYINVPLDPHYIISGCDKQIYLLFHSSCDGKTCPYRFMNQIKKYDYNTDTVLEYGEELYDRSHKRIF